MSGLSGIHVDAPARVVFGAATIRNNGPATVVLETASLKGDARASDAELVEVRALDVSDSHELVGAATWPYDDFHSRSRVVDGFALAPNVEAELLFIVDVYRTGRWSWTVPTVSYAVDGRRGVATSVQRFEICPTQQRCR
jgi:hypothetical protein